MGIRNIKLSGKLNSLQKTTSFMVPFFKAFKQNNGIFLMQKNACKTAIKEARES